MDITNQSSRNTQFGIIVGIACFVTNLSQLPSIVERGAGRYLSFPVWILLFLLCFLSSPMIRLRKIKMLFVIGVFFYLYLFFGTFFTDINRFDTSIPKVVPIAMFVALVGTQCGEYLSEKDLKWIFNMYTISALLVCLVVFRQYVFGSVLNSRYFAYSSKNSVSQILLTAWILIFFQNLKNDRKGLYFGFYAACLLLLTWTLLGLKSRGTLISIPLILAWALLKKQTGRKLRWLIFFIVVAAGAYLYTHRAVLNGLIENILYAGRDADDLNDISSGRVDEWINFILDYRQNGFFGDNGDKRESVILSSFLQHGVIGGILVCTMAVFPLVWFIRRIAPQSEYRVTLIAVAAAYSINGVFEQQAPFGPGVKCYFLWFILGIFATELWQIRHGKQMGIEG